MSDKFKELAVVYKSYLENEKPECLDLYEHTLAQWALESGWGTSELALSFNNFGGMKYRKVLASKFPNHAPYKDWSWEEVPYFKLDTLNDWPSLYFAFIGRSVYSGWEAHQECGSCFMKHLAKSGYCGSIRGVAEEDVPKAYAKRIEKIRLTKKFREIITYVDGLVGIEVK